jgi:hypothetical protein
MRHMTPPHQKFQRRVMPGLCDRLVFLVVSDCMDNEAGDGTTIATHL